MEVLGDGKFNVVLDKGTVDCILCGEASTMNVQKALSEISRVLDAKGIFITSSHSPIPIQTTGIKVLLLFESQIF